MPYLAGRNAVLEALRAGRRVRRVLIDETVRDASAIRAVLDEAAHTRVAVERVPRGRLDSLHRRHQGVAAEVAPFAYAPYHGLLDAVRSSGEQALVLVLDALQDPQNLGSLLRTALAVDVTGILMPERRTVEVTPSVVRASAGAVEHLTVGRAPNLARALSDLKALGVWVVGLDVQGGRPVDQLDHHGPLALVVGSEGTGLRRLVRDRCDFLVHLPMAGPTESLNAAVAGSIALYYVFRIRQRTASEAQGEPGSPEWNARS